jgi:hypothetical protein
MAPVTGVLAEDPEGTHGNTDTARFVTGGSLDHHFGYLRHHGSHEFRLGRLAMCRDFPNVLPRRALREGRPFRIQS